MNFDTPLVEYLIIGVHTSTWIYLIFLKSLDYPMTAVSKVDTAIVLLLLPFIYIVGMIFDDITYRVLRSRIKKIKDGVRLSWEKKKNKAIKSSGNNFNPDDYKDETLANRSEPLYNAYEAKVRRVRIVGSAIFNWPLLGIAILLNVGLASPIVIPMLITAIGLTIGSWLVWNGLYVRAYEFRLKAIDEIHGQKGKQAN